MTSQDRKTPIPNTPYFVIPGEDFFIRDEGVGAYQIEGIPLNSEGAQGVFDIELQQGMVHVSACFGSESWGVGIGKPVVIDGVRYSVSLHSDPVPFDEFDLASAADSLSFSMSNLDQRSKGGALKLNLPLSVEEDDPVYAETRARFVWTIARHIRELATAHPGFANGFRQAVAVLEIARLRDEQEEAWRAVSERTKAIHRYMALVPDEMARVAPWTFSSQETDPTPVGIAGDGFEINASGVHHATVKLVDGATFVIVGLVDGSIRTEIMRP
ncbi:hypothetical protein [Rhizobium sp. BK176]|uniref:hypothetical protein n=1 Tax=Rhizobium sp. BK176 TaxID=2587071 RepID=UPI002169FC46|nr:hypothetical protein [Rhizobium sp. BK176]MCS4089714.1 hypothetical protein [Rhizobium sp. BK176]